ncbi:hypothetical protein HDV04_001807 [Boothiomyces sp. JEL0838]|nr:hypothetical protein HDV04_001807 [Boothiomyces sp. JEL0838]
MNTAAPAGDITAVSKRLQSELMTLMMSRTEGISAFPQKDNLLHWIATIHGPAGTVYQGLTYKLAFDFPLNYPYLPPAVRFETTCFHPNVDINGAICLDILKDKWSAIYNVQTILLSVQSLLGEPNNESPLNTEAAQMWNDPVEFRKSVLKYHPESAGLE